MSTESTRPKYLTLWDELQKAEGAVSTLKGFVDKLNGSVSPVPEEKKLSPLPESDPPLAEAIAASTEKLRKLREIVYEQIERMEAILY